MKYVGDRIVYPQRDEDDQGYRIQIPTYHRAAVGIFPGTKLFMTPIPKTKDLIVTPIEPARWGDLWKIEAVLHDKPGATKSIIDTLVNRGVNILIQEGLSDYDEYGNIAHHLSLVVDLRGYSSKTDGRSNERNTIEKPGAKPNHLVSEIISKAVDYLHVTYAEDSWNFSFERMNFFFRHKEYRMRGRPQAVAGDEKTHLVYDSGDLRSIFVSDKILESEIFCGSIPDRLGCHILSDTEEKYIKIRFLNREGRYALLKIQHQDKIGVIRKFLDVLKKHNANITNSYNRLASMNEWALWHAFLEFPSKTRSSTVEAIVRDLHTIDEVSAISIPSHYGFTELRLPDLPKVRKPGDARHLQTGVVREINPLKISALGGKGSLVENILTERDELGVQPFYSGLGWKRQAGKIFIAMPFDSLYDEFYNIHIKPAIFDSGLSAVRLDETFPTHPRETMTEMISRMIATTDFVVADVSGFNGNVLYEVGLAHAIGKPVLIICEEKHRDSREGKQALLFDIQNYRHIFYSPYRAAAFVAVFKQNVEAISKALRSS